MITISTRQNRHGNWWCNTTVGYDYSFEGKTIADAQKQMKDLLDKKGIPAEERKWQEPKLYPKQEETPKPEIGYARWRIDKGMV